MFPTVLELTTDETDSIEIGPHGEPLVFFLHFFVSGVFLRERLMV